MRNIRKSTQSGFTIFELLVVLSIMIVISGVSIYKYRDFTEVSRLKNIAQDVALTLKEAQTFGVTTYESASGFEHGYGVYFSKSTPRRYTFFVDTDDNYWYSIADTDLREEWLETGYYLSDICVGPVSTEDCTPTEIAISFRRPVLTAHARISSVTGDENGARLHFQSPEGRERVVHTTVTGQIYVQ